MIALIDGDRSKRIGRNKYTASTFISDTHKQCSYCDKIKLHSEFHKCKTHIHGKGLSYYCKECAIMKSQAYHRKQIEINNVEYIRAKRSSRYKLQHKISLDEFESRLKAQNNKCKICGIHLESSGYTTHMDHDHKTGKLRDILCTNCNRGLGHFHDNTEILMEAIKYLQSHTDNGNQKEGRCL